MIRLINFSLVILFFVSNITQAQIVEFEHKNIQYQYKKLNQPQVANGLLVLFGYGGGNGLTDIPKVFENDSILVIVIDNKSWFMPIEETKKNDACILHAMETNNIPEKRLIFGGFSGGGTTTMRYTEQVIKRGISKLTPKGIFIGDAPIDHLEFYKYCEKELSTECDAPDAWMGKHEAKIIKHEYDSLLGDPVENREKYIQVSPATVSEPDLGNGKYLLNMPIRFYHEPDPMFYIIERCRTSINSHLNSSSVLVNYLYHNGNKKAEIILTQDKGYRTNGNRHPHSWSIIDAKGLLDWYNEL